MHKTDKLADGKIKPDKCFTTNMPEIWMCAFLSKQIDGQCAMHKKF